MEKYHMVAPGDHIVAGVSGGADSVCLLFLLLAFGEKKPISLAVVHVNHGIRPEAGADAEFVEGICRERGIPFFLTTADVPALAAREKISPEDAGRRVRYEAFCEAARKMGGARIAVAHNLDDNAETMLFHLFRGSGIRGLGGIPPVRGDIIRPILCLERREVEAYLGKRQIPWRTDSTNSGDAYCRNRIRHHILPFAEREITGGVTAHMGQTAEILRETEAYLEQQTKSALEECCKAGDGYYAMDAEGFGKIHSVLQKRIIHFLLKKMSPTGKDIGAVHVRDTMSLFEKKENRSIRLPFGILARRQYGEVILETGAGEEMGGAGADFAIVRLTEEIFAHPAVYDLEKGGKIELFGLFIKKGQEVPQNQYTKWFDYDKIEESLEIRTRRRGDFLTIADGKGGMAHKSLKDYMIAEKIPRQARDRMPLLVSGSHVLWVAGHRISEYFKVNENTERILRVRLLSGEQEGKSKTEEKNVGTH